MDSRDSTEYPVEAYDGADEEYYYIDDEYYYIDEDYYNIDYDLEPLWYEFIVYEDHHEQDTYGKWAVVMTYDYNLTEFYLWTSDDHICLMNLDPDFTFFEVENCPECSCPYPVLHDWYESTLVMDTESDEISPLYITGPFGEDWYFIDLDTFSSEYPDEYDDFYSLVNSGEEYNFDEDIYYGYDDYGDFYDYETEPYEYEEPEYYGDEFYD